MPAISPASFVKNAISKGAQGFALDAESCVALKAFPVRADVPPEGSFYKFTRTDLQRIQHDGRRINGYAKGTDYGLSTDTYSCQARASRHLVGDREIRSANGVYNAQQVYTQAELAQVLRIVENQWASSFFTTGVWTATGTDGTPGTKWDCDLAGSPRKDVMLGRKAITDVLGAKPQYLVGICGPEVFHHLSMHPELVNWAGVPNAQFDASAALFNTEAQIAAKLGLDALYVSMANKVTSREGATAAQSSIVGDGFLILHVNTNPFDTAAPTAACTFVDKPLAPRIYRDEGLEEGSFYVEASISLAQKVVASELGYFISNCIT